MAKFPPNLDDGELWLPSDIFPDELASGFRNPLYSVPEHARMAELARRFASYSLAHRRRTQTAAIPAPIGSFPAGYLRLNGDFGLGHGNEAYNYGYRVEEPSPVPLNRAPVPVQPQVGFAMVPDPVLLNREVRNPSPNPVWPLQRSGTGVFLPRVGAAATTTAGGRKRPSVRNKQDLQVVTQRSSLAMADMGKKKQEDQCHYHLPPDMGLPQEWTY